MRKMALEEEAEIHELREKQQESKASSTAVSSSGERDPSSDTIGGPDGERVPSSGTNPDEESDDTISATEDIPVEGPPQHESATASRSTDDLERATRTVFFGNVSTVVLTSKSSKRTLLAHLKLASSPSPLQIETIRFRSTPYADLKQPKKAGYVTGDVHDATAKSTNAYAVYKTAAMSRTAVSSLNGTIVLERHLRADSVAHPSKVDHRRCVFVGNLGFVDDESAIVSAENEDREARTEGAKKRKAKPPGDVEEGLWRQFGKAGVVESVRVVRDAKTRVGKGFAYVQFQNADAVELALLYEGQKYPPMLPRKLRVTRAKNPKKTASATRRGAAPIQRQRRVAEDEDEDADRRQRELQGRARKLFGKAGAASVNRAESQDGARERRQPPRKMDGLIFEGTRATKQGGTQRRLASGKGPSKRGKGKPTTRSSRRGTAWKASGGQK